MNADAHAPGPRPLLRVRLVRQVLLPLGLAWLVGVGLMVAVAQYFTQKAYDRALVNDAFALAGRVRLHSQQLKLELSSPEMSALLFDQSENLYFAVRRLDGELIAGHSGLIAVAPPRPGVAALSDLTYRGVNLRIVTFWREEPFAFQVIVGQTTGSRRALLRDLFVYSVAPLVVLLLVLAWWLRRNISQEIRPLSELQQSLEQRDARDLAAVPVSGTSLELEQLGMTINALLARVEHSLRAQQEFSGNVAHELRTPLAGIRALAEYGLAQQDPAVWREQLVRIAGSETRASRLVEQLLALALADEDASAVQIAPLALDEVVRETVLRYLPRADAAGVDLGVHGLDEPVQVTGSMALIEGILGNLLDNALRYGRPSDGSVASVTVELRHGPQGVRLSVTDNGPGLTPQERSALMQRGVRGLHSERLGQGAGLGLAIVARFAQLLQARFELGDAPSGRGLCASLTFPPPAGATT